MEIFQIDLTFFRNLHRGDYRLYINLNLVNNLFGLF